MKEENNLDLFAVALPFETSSDTTEQEAKRTRYMQSKDFLQKSQGYFVLVVPPESEEPLPAVLAT
ncbi:MAG TPA: hypothetical protein VE843_09095 [Ktedonobacteraceae bacterium]|nr:hypothetical protein [Ktedonobacteraceae bacterium]